MNGAGENPGILEIRLIIRNPDDNFHRTERQVLCPGSDHPDTAESKLLFEDLLFLFLSCERHPEENLQPNSFFDEIYHRKELIKGSDQ